MNLVCASLTNPIFFFKWTLDPAVTPRVAR